MSQITAIYPCFLAGLKSKKPPANLLAGGFSDLLNIVFLNIIQDHLNFHISRSYSPIVLSEEKYPAWLMLTNIFLAHKVRSS